MCGLLTCSLYTFSFIANREGVMIASDVAARGLDIPHVQHVIHYQVPRNSEVRGESP